MQVILTIQSGSQAGRKLWLKVGQTLRFGRTERADVAVSDDPRMSSLHFEVRCTADGARARDLGSANGTFVNGAPVTETVLRPNDLILAGSTTVSVDVESPRTQVAAGDFPAAVPDQGRDPDRDRDRELVPAAGWLPTRDTTPPLPSPLGTVASALPSGAAEDVDRVAAESPPRTDRSVSANNLTEDRPELFPAAAPASDATPRGPESPPSSLLPVEIVIVEIERSDAPGQQFWLTPGQVVIVGTAADCHEVVAAESGLEPHHFALRLEPTTCRLQDLAPSAGTWLNDRKAADAVVEDGDVIRAGNYIFRVRVVRQHSP